MTTRVAPANGIEICYETFGDSADPAMLLVMGLTAQMIVWPDDFCRGLAAQGYHVIRFDNRDCGLSTHLDGVAADVEGAMLAQLGEGPPPSAPYTLSTFAADACGLLSTLGIDRAHIVGASMGGMIVQAMAIEHPDRVLSMTSIMSTTGEREFFESSPEALAGLLAPPASERDAYVRQIAENAKIFGSRRYYDEAASREQAGRSFDRAFYPEGNGRQLVAIAASGDRADGLRALNVPTLVIHGRDDELILPSGGLRTAELVPGAVLMFVSDMGHDLPEPLWPVLIDAIASHAGRHAG
jgi:pimeloyl-ACP methyl ester carboxylesterase